jgi:amino acid adenylation domain-containing protein
MINTDNIAERTAKLSAAKRALIEKRLRGVRSEAKGPQVVRRRQEQGPAVLSFAQQRLWFIDQLEAGSSFYNNPVAVRLSGMLQREVLERTLSEIVRRHEILRTHFEEAGGKPVQVISPAAPLPLPVTDLSELDEAGREATAIRLAAEEAATAFDLARGPLIRAKLLRLSEEEHVVLLTMHHIVTDGWSTGVLVREVAALYEAYARGLESPLPELELQYADYAAWQRQWLQGEALEEQLGYWRKQLGGKLPVLELPSDRPRLAVQSFRGARCSMKLSPELVESLTALGRREGATLYMTLLAAFQTLLHRYTGQEDVLVGTAIANRNRAEIENLIGVFANTLVMRTSLAGDPTFVEVLRMAREVSLGAYAHQDLPFEKLVEELQPERDLGRLPLFQTMLILQNAPSERLELGDLRLSRLEVQNLSAKLDLLLTMTEGPRGLNGIWIYNTDLFDAATVERMMGHFRTLLEAVAADPRQRISALPLLSQAEWHQSVVGWNGAASEPTRPRCMHELFEEHAARTPEAVAVVYEDEELTYGELNRRANQLAHYLKKLGVGPQVLVGICVERSVEMIVGLLGILKAGGTYVPLDPTYPQERLRFMLEDSQTPVLLTQQSLLPDLPVEKARVVCLDADWPLVAREGTGNPAAAATPESLAYCIYTSGSTGRPKGVMVCHRTVVHLFHALQPEIGFDAGDVWTVVHSYAFDFSVWEIWGALLHGGRLVVVPLWVTRTPSAFYDLLRTQRVTILNQTPSAFAQLIAERGEDGWESGELPLKLVVLGGDALPQELFARIGPGSTPVWNFYGPTEATVWTTVQRLDRNDGAVSIGRPMADTQVYVLDRRQQPVPVGVAGELYIGGDGLAKGYLNRPALTAEKFIAHPFSAEEGARLYRTGDLVRRLADGRLDFLGRIDHQVKVRGFRIELGEVEAALSAHPSVGECVVMAREDDRGDKRLVAYLVAAPGEEGDVTMWREHLRSRLPEYMVPSAFVTLDSLPLTPNGKVDRKALPAPGEDAGRDEMRQPRTPVEEVLAGIFAEVLRVKAVGVEESFFDLGGHSLLATQLMSRVREAFSVEVALRKLFEEPTVAGLASHVEGLLRSAQGISVPPITRASRDGHLPLSFSQYGQWFIDQLEAGSAFYNIPVAVRLSGALDVEAMERAFAEVVRRHEVLRTRFAEADGEPVQLISPPAPLSLPVTDLSGLGEADREAEVTRRANAETHELFDLTAGPLLRVSLLRLSDEEHVVLLTMHHIVTDGWSIGILIKEVAALYEAFSQGLESPLPELKLQYADYAAWQRGWLQGEVLEQQLSYWRKQLGGSPAVLELPTDRPRPAVQSFRGATCPVSLSATLTEALLELSRREGVTLFMTLLAAFQTLLYRYSGQEDVSVGAPVAGRSQRNTEDSIGYFANTLVLRTSLSGELSFRELLGRVREVSLEAFTHQDVPFEKVVEALQPKRDLSYNPLFQVLFALHNLPTQAITLPELTLTMVPAESVTSRFDMALDLRAGAQGVRGSLEYSTDLFDERTIKSLIRHLENLLESAVAEPERRLSELPLLTVDEREQMLVGWNDAKAEYPRDTCLHEVFEAHAERTPEAVAVCYEAERITYGELNRRANRLARHLRRRGVGSGDLVAICVERSLDMVVGLLGILKSGAAYVPLDPAYPRERLRFVLEDSRAAVLLTQSGILHTLPVADDVQVLCLDTDWEAVARESDENPGRAATADGLAYVIYTSGSTGRPKGVQVGHRSAVCLLEVTRPVFDFNPDDVWTVFHSYGFDFSVWEIWGCLLSGGRLVVVPGAMTYSPAALYRMLCEERVTVLSLTPSAVRQVVQAREDYPEQSPSFRLIVCGGEAFPGDLAPQLLGWGVPVWNFYGPTEATVWAIIKQVEPDDIQHASVPIGRPIANTQAYVLDRRQQPVPVGVAGELYIGGDGLARGYLNRPALTAEKFIAHPFCTEPGARLYRTGDLARFLADGRLDFLGRIDHQVKVRGFRIELGEVEAALSAHASVSECVVVAREDEPGDKRLVAYLVGTSDTQAVAAGELREHLRSRLPEYMVPSAFVLLPELPLTHSGKVDRKALPAPGIDDAAGRGGIQQPQTPVEEVLAGIFAEVLRVREVGVDENFFDLGGHSLLATQLMSRVREVFSVEVGLRRLFEGPTVAELAAHVQGLLCSEQGMLVPPVVRASREGRLPVSFAQRRLWFIDQMEGGSAFYNIPAGVRLSGVLDVEALGRTLMEVVRRHEVLRTYFTEVEGEPVQVISPAAELPLPLTDLSGMDEEECEAEVRRLSAEEGRMSFDLGRGPLIRARLLHISEEEHVVLLTMHHIVADGWSFGVLIKELAALYAAYARGEESPLPELELQYADYAAWQRGWLQGGALEQQLSYWRKQLGGKLPVLEMPTDRPRPPVQTFRGSQTTFTLRNDVAEGVRELSRKEGVTLFMTLLAAFKVLLSRYTNQEDVVIGSAIAGRNRKEIEPLIGFFINTLVLRTDVGGNPRFRELLRRVREVTLSAYAHQDVPFEKLVEELQPERSLSHTPLFQVAFGVQNAPAETLELPGLRLSPVGGGNEVGRFDLTVWVAETVAGTQVRWSYNTDLFDAERVERMQGHFEQLLASATAEPEARLSALDMLTTAEKAQKSSEQDEQEEASLRKLMGARRKSFRRVRETEAETKDNSTPGDVPSPQRPHGVDATI